MCVWGGFFLKSLYGVPSGPVSRGHRAQGGLPAGKQGTPGAQLSPGPRGCQSPTFLGSLSSCYFPWKDDLLRTICSPPWTVHIMLEALSGPSEVLPKPPSPPRSLGDLHPSLPPPPTLFAPAASLFALLRVNGKR